MYQQQHKRKRMRFPEILLQDYLNVSRCWHNHEEAVRQNMTVEKAIRLLRATRNLALEESQLALAKRANKLLQEIVEKQADNVEVTG